MTGEDLRNIIEKSDKSLADVARHLFIIPQTLNSKLKSKDLSYSFVNTVLKFIGSDVKNENIVATQINSSTFDKETLQKQVETLKHQNESLISTNEILREHIDTLKKHNNALQSIQGILNSTEKLIYENREILIRELEKYAGKISTKGNNKNAK